MTECVCHSFSHSGESSLITVHSLVICELKVKIKWPFLFQMESLKQAVHSFIAVMSYRQEVVPVSDPCEAANHSLNFSSGSPLNKVEAVCMVGNSEQRLGELIDKEAETLEFPDNCAIIMTPWFLRSHLQ